MSQNLKLHTLFCLDDIKTARFLELFFFKLILSNIDI